MNPAIIAALISAAGSAAGKLFGGSGSSGGGMTAVNVSQNVGQNQTTNIGSSVGSQRDVADQLAFLLGAPYQVATLPPTVTGDSAHIQNLYTDVLNQKPPVTGGIGDSRYSPLTGGLATTPGTNINQILIYVGIGLAILLIAKKKFKRS